ncbi:hypothetical protein D3C81_1723160 [compost metagenome]
MVRVGVAQLEGAAFSKLLLFLELGLLRFAARFCELRLVRFIKVGVVLLLERGFRLFLPAFFDIYVKICVELGFDRLGATAVVTAMFPGNGLAGVGIHVQGSEQMSF